MDNFSSSSLHVGFRNDLQLHYGGIHPYPISVSRNHDRRQNDSRKTKHRMRWIILLLLISVGFFYSTHLLGSAPEDKAVSLVKEFMGIFTY